MWNRVGTVSSTITTIQDFWMKNGTLTTAHLLEFLLVNLAASGLFALTTQILLKKPRDGHRVLNIFALTVYGGMIPVLGPLLILIGGLAYPILQRAPRRQLPALLKRPEFAAEVESHSGQFGHGGALARLRSPGADSRQAARALIAIETRRDQATTRLLNETLGHPDETLRLIAHNLLGRREKAVVARMTDLEKTIRSANQATPRMALDLAELHLEFLYLGIVEGALRSLHLDAAERLLAGLGDPDPELPWITRLLLLRARLKQVSAPSSEKAEISENYKRALELGAAPSRALPWLLEQAWHSRDYPAIQQLANKYPVNSGIPVIGPVMQRWSSHGDT